MSHTCLCSPAAERHRTLQWLVLVFRPAEGRRLSWPEWLATNRGGLPACRRSSIPVRARQGLTSLIETNALPLSQAATRDVKNMFFLLVKYFMKYFSILTVSFETFQTIFLLYTFTLTDTLRKNKSSVMVANTNPIA